MAIFNIDGYEIDVKLPSSPKECEERISYLMVKIAKLKADATSTNNNNKESIKESKIEKHILETWQKSTYAQLERKIADSDLSHINFKSEAGLIQSLHSILLSKNVKYTQNELVVLEAAREWLRNELCKNVPPEEFIPDAFRVKASKEEVAETAFALAFLKSQQKQTQSQKANTNGNGNLKSADKHIKQTQPEILYTSTIPDELVQRIERIESNLLLLQQKQKVFSTNKQDSAIESFSKLWKLEIAKINKTITSIETKIENEIKHNIHNIEVLNKRIAKEKKRRIELNDRVTTFRNFFIRATYAIILKMQIKNNAWAKNEMLRIQDELGWLPSAIEALKNKVNKDIWGISLDIEESETNDTDDN